MYKYMRLHLYMRLHYAHKQKEEPLLARLGYQWILVEFLPCNLNPGTDCLDPLASRNMKPTPYKLHKCSLSSPTCMSAHSIVPLPYNQDTCLTLAAKEDQSARHCILAYSERIHVQLVT
jgi:hypothetical protein